MTLRTNCDEVVLDVVSQQAARLDMMYLKIFTAAAMLTSPTIALQNAAMQLHVRACVKSQARSFGGGFAHFAPWPHSGIRAF